jgi:hypothetical protein
MKRLGLAALLALTACTSVQEAMHIKRAKTSALLLTAVPLDRPTHAPLTVGQPTTANSKLTIIASRSLLPPDMLTETENGAPKLFALDPTFTDFQRLSVNRTEAEGLYRFTFTPKHTTYRVWAKAVSAETVEYPFTDLGGRSQGKFPKTETLTRTWNGYEITLLQEKPFRRFYPSTLTLKATKNGQEAPATIEEIFGVYNDYRTAEHLLPSEEGIRFEGTQEGFIRLFVRASIDGKETTLPFTAAISK